MKYKTTYFYITPNNQISINEDEYYWKSNPEELTEQIYILSMIPIIEEYDDENFLVSRLLVADLSDDELILYKNKHHEYYESEGYDKESSITPYRAERLLSLREFERNINKNRFEESHRKELEKHLNENSSDGYKLFSMTPIYKGLNQTDYWAGFDAGYGYGYGHDVLEGFVMIWEKLS